VPLHPFRKQAFSATLTPPRENGAAAFCFHPRAEAMLAFAGAF
jgi:hypothetical protein